MHRDSDMMELVNGVLRNCRPNTSNLNEQLAMVRYIFTDKTGTLTENVMNFKRGDIRGHVVTDDDWKKSAELLNPNHPCRDAAVEYFLALSLCHTVQPVTDSNTSEIVYEGSSPDELALVKTAARHGFRLIDRTSKTITVDEEGLICVYDILATLEFTSERKMMSIVVRRQSGDEIILYTKGADGSIFAQASENSTVQNYALRLKGTLAEMGDYGLRTLLVARRSITQCEFTEWQSQFAQASKLITNRTSAVDKVCLELERKLWLLGATAIEDKLQDKVPETISFFLNAGVVIWMLTGDKRETAVTIGATASLCDPRKDYIVHIDIGSLSPRDPAAAEKVAADIRQVELAVARARETNSHCSFVIDGLALGVAMEKYFDTFLRVSQCVNSAICCRLTPLQKANIVRMFQKSTGHTAIAIGDGANDVSMIQEGRVGVGIIGLEGSQAALSADYAIPRFKNLRRLCAVHGRYSVVRNASCIVVSFYKNATLSIIQILFSIYCGFSGETLFDGWLLTFFNIILTSLPPFLMGIFDEDLPEGVLERSPKLFAPLSRGLYFNMFVVVRWLFEATFHGVALFYVVFPTLKQRDWNRDHNASGSMIGTVELIILVCVVFARIALQIKCWRVVHILGLLLSMVVTITLLLVYSALLHVGDSSIYWQMYLVVVSPKFWLYLVLSVGTLIVVIDLSILHFQKHFWPTMRDLAENEELRMLATVRKNGPTGNVAAAKVDDSSLL
ncbi:putative Cation transport ATPase (P type) Phospholipid translocating P type ATPase C terminal [Trypanosoma vivax]|nr:putative Cation transport ATPase (P type) Phospholipid translocating P type ATPase C terminal [Trypanosoma vivax]